MWKGLGRWVVRNRIWLLIVLSVSTVVMAYFASQVKLSYEFSKAIPTDNPRYQDYRMFREKFGDDGNLMVIGVHDTAMFHIDHYRAFANLEDSIRTLSGVQSTIGFPGAVTLIKDNDAETLRSSRIFENVQTQEQLDSARAVFFNLPFYRERLYHPASNAYLLGVRVDPAVMATKERSELIASIVQFAKQYEKTTGLDVHCSGLPLIRTQVADRIQAEMKFFLCASLLFSVLILIAFFRSVSTTLLSLGVVIIGVVYSVAIIHLCGYQITLLTALMPSLIVVIGIPNCIYFINKFHSAFKETGNKREAVLIMVAKMGVVTLFCNIAAAIGFAVFALTESAILKEFGIVAGLSIMVIFVVSFILLPAILYMLPAPRDVQLRYLNNKLVTKFLNKVEHWAFHRKKTIVVSTVLALAFAVAGLFQLRSEGHIVDDLPRADRIYTDLRFFEKNFKGVMPLEILIQSKKKNGFIGMRALKSFEKIDSLAAFIAMLPDVARPLSLAEGLKFAKQGFYEMDSTQYLMPNTFDGAFVAEYLRAPRQGDTTSEGFSNVMRSFMDSTRTLTRMSVTMKDVGTEKLPLLLDTIERQAAKIFDTAQYKVTLTGTSITFLEGSRFIISGLKESIFWAFLLITVCMLYLFRGLRIVVCSLVPNVIPLVVTAGMMGWLGVPLKPSTVLVFSVALGIAVDITIRFLVNYKQELPQLGGNVAATVRNTIRHTGLSIIYTSLVLIAGFVLFCFSSFGGTVSLGWLTSFTLIMATLTNLVLLPVLILWVFPQAKMKTSKAADRG